MSEEEIKKMLNKIYEGESWQPMTDYILELQKKNEEILSYYNKIYEDGIYTGQKAIEQKIREIIEKYKLQYDENFVDDISYYNFAKEIKKLLEE